MGKTLRADTLPAYELVQPTSFQQKPGPAHPESDDAMVTPTSRLPPKPLPGRQKYRPFVLATLIAVLNVLVLAVLLAHIKYFLPATDWDGYGIQSTGTSCDLVNKENSTRWQSTFQINLRGAAHLSFAEAKFIDLVFDLILGQGGRLLLAAVSYFVFMDALLRSMETTPVSYKLYASLVFSSISLVATWRASKAVFTTKGWRAKLYLTWCVLAMIYVLAFPTLIESMTGYVSPSSPGFQLANGQFVRSDSDDLKSCFNVTGGFLLGFDQNVTKAVGPAAHVFDAASSAGFSLKPDPGEAPSGVNSSSPFWSLASYDFDPVYNRTSRENFTRTDGTLGNGRAVGKYTTNITINGGIHFFNNSSPSNYAQPAYCYNDLMLELNQMKPSTYCFNKEYFVWGFSSIVLYVTLGLQLAWTLGMYCLWLDANLASELVKTGRTIRGPFRAAADLAEAMKETLGDEYCAYTDKEIEKELERSGNMLRYHSTLSDDDDQLLHVGLTSQPGAKVLLSRQKLYGAEDKGRRRRERRDDR
ncbi:MAG: hypothetical protein L6R38_009555 [Xanthoria sp. 2 TBL-2021]|nr:MAG: hypothetical protein L6R38_009555 [Xanthoria sp. 2 TBL-2021]